MDKYIYIIYVWYEKFRAMNISRLKKKNSEIPEKYMHMKNACFTVLLSYHMQEMLGN